MVDVFMALLSFRGFDTPSLQAQGEQRRSTYFNIGRDIPGRTIAGVSSFGRLSYATLSFG
jgi:hypothetical protein